MNIEPKAVSQRSALSGIFHGIVAIKYSLQGFLACFRMKLHSDWNAHLQFLILF